MPSARDQASNLENADTTASNEKMTSSRALVALAVALLAASTGKVPLLSPPVKAVLSFVLPASLGGGSGGAFSSDVAGDDGSTSHLRANRLLSIALRNATSDYDEVRMLALLERKQSKGQRRGFVASARGGIPPPFPPLAPPGKNFKMASDNKLIFFSSPPLFRTSTHAIQLASIVSEWFRSPEHGAEDEAAFIEFLKFKAKR